MIDCRFLEQMFSQYGLSATERMLEQFDCYAELLVDWNQRINLTAITESQEICSKHFLDSALLLKQVELKQGSSVIDVGTGAGFPSLPCKILRPDLELTLLDSLNKRINFLQAVSENLHISTNCIHSRAEDGGKNPTLREQFDLATARAVAHLRELSEYCLPFVKVGGTFVALKGPEIEEELQESKKALKLLGGEVLDVVKYSLPGDQKRAAVLVRKVSQTPTKYPRMTAKMKKQPLK